MKKFIILILASLTTFACAKSNDSIYAGLEADQDGVLDAEIPFDGSEDKQEPQPSLVLTDTLTKAESDIAKTYHKNQLSRFSFVIVDAKSNQVMRSYKAQQPRRLASVTKISTALTALENVNGPSVSKIQSMLKSSNNGEASRYLRLAIKTMFNYVVPGAGYSAAASCPTAVNNESQAGTMMLDWIQHQVPDVNWSGAALKDGAGCNYSNQMTAVQTAKILQFADAQGAAYGGLTFEKLLSISGVDGTWASRNTDHKGLVLAKTGTLNPNANLAGYFYARRNGVLNKYYFAVFVEKDTGTTNANNARTFIEMLVRNWINYYAKQTGEPIAKF